MIYYLAINNTTLAINILFNLFFDYSFFILSCHISLNSNSTENENKKVKGNFWITAVY